MTDVFGLPVFPAADVFPMMADDELQELAADIKENGLREPLVVAEAPDADGVLSEMLIDGRNRRAACKMAGVEPVIRHLNGEDPTAFVLSANIFRRHMTKGQRAMAVAKVCLVSKQSIRSASKQAQLTAGRVAQASTVLGFAPDLADNVLSGASSLDDAYRVARERKQAASSEEAQLSELRQRAPEIADKVVEGELTLVGAKAEADAREEQARNRRATVFHALQQVLNGLDCFVDPEIGDEIGGWLADPDLRREFKAAFPNCRRGKRTPRRLFKQSA